MESLIEYWPYIALAVVVAGITQALKKAFTKFFTNSVVGMRILPFVPIVLGMLGGLLLPLETITNDLLVGGMLGTLSASIYKIVTRTLAKKATLEARLE